MLRVVMNPEERERDSKLNFSHFFSHGILFTRKHLMGLYWQSMLWEMPV